MSKLALIVQTRTKPGARDQLRDPPLFAGEPQVTMASPVRRRDAAAICEDRNADSWCDPVVSEDLTGNRPGLLNRVHQRNQCQIFYDSGARDRNRRRAKRPRVGRAVCGFDRDIADRYAGNREHAARIAQA